MVDKGVLPPWPDGPLPARQHVIGNTQGGGPRLAPVLQPARRGNCTIIQIPGDSRNEVFNCVLMDMGAMWGEIA